MKKKGKKTFRNILIILIAILLVGVTFFIGNKDKSKLEIKSWNNIYNENNINMYYSESSNAKIKALDDVYQVNKLTATEDSELNKVLKVVDIVNSIVEFDDVSTSKRINAFDILQEKAGQKKVSQRDMAIITRDLISTMDIKARVGEFKKTKRSSDEGVSYYIVEYWSNDYEKWVMVDFRDRGYVEKKGIPSSAIEIVKTLDKSMTYVGKTQSSEYLKSLKKTLDIYTVNIDNTTEMEKSNSYISFVKDTKNIKIKLKNRHLPPTVFTENEGLFNENPKNKEIGVDEKGYIILMKKENSKEESAVKSESYIVGGFKGGKIMNCYYLRENNSEFKEVEKYSEFQLVNGSNLLELSIDGENVISSIEIEYKE